MERLPWQEYWMDMAKLVSSRSTCRRRSVGAVLVKNNLQISSGYNGAPRGAKHCLEIGCIREDLGVPSGERHELCRAMHAEQNAIIQCARTGASTEGATLYCTTYPCSICAKMIINAGIVCVVYEGDYPDPTAKKLFEDAMHVEVKQFKRG